MMKINVVIFIVGLLLARTASAQVLVSEVQISPIGNRFIELYNSGSTDVDLTGWYIQRKTTSGNSFSSLVSSTQLKSKTIKANEYFLVSRVGLPNSDVVVGDLTLTPSNVIRVRDSKGEDVDQLEWGTIADGMSYQKTSGGWVVSVPTPGVSNSDASVSVSQTTTQSAAAAETQNVASQAQSTTSSFPVEPQIFADAGPNTLTVSTGATVTFAGKAWGLKKEPIENARMVWSFGDGGTSEGSSVAHVFYYPGEYTVVLDVASGFYSASDRIRVVAVTPSVALHAGGDTSRSYVTLLNNGSEELDLSSWQIACSGKLFNIPKNTFIGAKKTLTFASEVTGIYCPLGSNVTLHFPNGTRVGTLAPQEVSVQNPIAQKTVSVATSPAKKVSDAVTFSPSQKSITAGGDQQASLLGAVTPSSGTRKGKSDPWVWYTSVALLGLVALLGIRFVQGKEEKTTFTVDDFEIVEEVDDFDKNEPH